MLRRLHTEQPESFAFTPENQKWAEAQIANYPEGRQASAVIPLLWRAQEQEGWVTKPMIEAIAKMLGMAYIRVLEVASFYFMFQLKPVGSVAHFQICGTTSCMICGAEDLVAVAKEKIARQPHALSPDGKFSWEEVECLGACSNAPMAQIGKDYYEDLTAERFAAIIDAFAAGEVPTPGPQTGRFASEPADGLTSLGVDEAARMAENASMELARILQDTTARITDGRPWGLTDGAAAAAPRPAPAAGTAAPAAEAPAASTPAPATPMNRKDEETAEAARPAAAAPDKQPPAGGYGGDASPATELNPDAVGEAPALLDAPRDGAADDLKRISGVGPKLESLLNEMGVWHFDQIAAWTPREIAWVDARLSFKGRIERDGWIEQARALAAGGNGDTET